MKTHLMCIVLFCCGLFALHLAAQSAKTESPAKTKLSLLDPKMEECSEKELLELKILSCRKMLELRNHAAEAGTEAGGTPHVAEARANLAAAEAELYRHTGEREKLLTALKTKVEALREKLNAESHAYGGGMNTSMAVYATEVQLLDALLEQKRTRETER